MDIQPTPQMIDRALEAIQEENANEAPPPQQFINGFEFELEEKEAMVWSGQTRKGRYGGYEWVYIVVVGWSVLRVMTEAQIEQAIDPIDIYADNHPRWDGD
jgi:hypothetical protein